MPNQINILWIISETPENTERAISILASNRLRCFETKKHIEAINPDINISLCGVGVNVQFDIGILNNVDLVVIGKILFDLDNLFPILQTKNIGLILDICDDVLNLPKHRPRYLHAIEYANAIVCSTVELKDYFVNEYPEITANSIDDFVPSVPSPPIEINSDKGSPIHIGWFGVGSNLPALEPWIDQLNQSEIEVVLTIVTGLTRETVEAFRNLKAKYSRISINTADWSEQAQSSLLSNVDFIIIPASKGKIAKTANRLITAINAGVPAIASPLHSYNPFKEYVAITDDVLDGIKWWQSQSDPASCILEAQSYILNQYNSERIANEWINVLKDIAENRHKHCSLIENSDSIRLNLGSGDKLLKNYINVDLVEERAKIKPDVQCDIRNLHVFENNYADEILSVHVVEHFYQWEIQALLAEWIRVLKPGGKMVIECPNLLTVCSNILKNPISNSKPGNQGQMGIWGLYGDPAWKDPLMCHKWLYSPQSLADEMNTAGLTDLRAEAPQFKQREKRDMRIVGRKPK